MRPRLAFRLVEGLRFGVVVGVATSRFGLRGAPVGEGLTASG
jgi:hypothetical protein